MIEIDGSYGEGGGQILRMSVALAALTNKPVKVFNIRANRPNPGLRRQHMVAIESVAKICNARVRGLELGSKAIEFYPGELKGGEYEFDIGTAGSVTLVLQACLLPSLFAKDETHLRLRGGTDVKWSPPWDYFQNVIVPLLGKMGGKIESYLNKRGYYPVGGGEVEVHIYPCEKLDKLEFDEKIEGVEGIINIANLPIAIAERIENSALKELRKHGMEADIMIEETSAACSGVGIVLWTKGKILGADCLGEKGKPAEQVGKEAAEKLVEEVKAGVDLDENAVDQMLPYIAMADDALTFKCRNLSRHATTLIWLIKKFLDVKFEIEKNGVYEVKVRRK